MNIYFTFDGIKFVEQDKKTRKFIDVDNQLNIDLLAIYNTHKPEIKETQKFQLIGCNIIFNNGKCSGIINFRINGNHEQIRF